ncbi:uncharacterized protein O3C94_007289 [Discoglossus pictus]
MACLDKVTLELPTLGRPFQLGGLYDCRSDTLIQGVTLWNMSTLQKYIKIQPQPKTEFHIISSDTIEDKASALNLSASLKASVLSGLVEVNGSGTYLRSSKGSKWQARVTLKYSATTVFKSLTMHHLGSQNLSYPDVIDHGTATHVVTAVLYGAQAFFVFDQEVSSTDDIQKIHGQLEAMVKNIPKVALGGGGKFEKSKDKIMKSAKISCRFYGDFALQSNPVTYKDAINTYSTLPKLLGEDGDKAVAVKVWLYPLAMLDSKAAKIAQEITINVLSDIQTAMEQLLDIDMTCNDLLKNPVAKEFLEMKDKIQQFRHLCTQCRLTFQRQLARALPSIRGGKEDEGLLVDILTRKERSPFSMRNLKGFVDTKQQEMDCVNSYLSILKDVKIISSETGLNQMLLDPKITIVVSFTFTSLQEEESFLSSLKKSLQSPQMIESEEEPFDGQINTKQWFQETKVNMKGRRNLTMFLEYANANKSNNDIHFIVSSVRDKDNPGTSIYLYEEGQLVCKQFHPPKMESSCETTTEKNEDGSHCGSTESNRNQLLSKLLNKQLIQVNYDNNIENIPSIYKLVLKSVDCSVNEKYERWQFGAEDLQKTNKVIMMVGGAGSGKTTLLNAMVNYVLGVEWEDNYRFKLVEEITNKSQAHSQTTKVIAYQINHVEEFKIPYSLTIVDTPGFGDTRGIGEDKKILEKIHECFNSSWGIDQINSICFVVQSSLARLTPSQKYVFDSILSIFGKDIEQNIQICATFVDVQKPQVLEALLAADVPCAKDEHGAPIHFKFNNSSLYVNNTNVKDEDAASFNPMFWKMGMMSIKKFFTTFAKLESRSVTLTKEVLKERQALEVTLQGINPKIEEAMLKLHELEKIQTIVNLHHDDIDKDANFEYEVKKTIKRKKDKKKNSVNCSECESTCHGACLVTWNMLVYFCEVFYWDSSCRVCGHSVRKHKCDKYNWENVVVTAKETYAELKGRYEKACNQKITAEELLGKLKEECDSVAAEAKSLIERASESHRRLEEIALKPNPLSTPDYIDLLIHTEKCEEKPGYLERIDSLEKAKSRARMLRGVQRKKLNQDRSEEPRREGTTVMKYWPKKTTDEKTLKLKMQELKKLQHENCTLH